MQVMISGMPRACLPWVVFMCWVCVEFCVSVPSSTVTLSNSVFTAWLFAASAALAKPGGLTSLTTLVHPLADQLKKKKRVPETA